MQVENGSGEVLPPKRKRSTSDVGNVVSQTHHLQSFTSIIVDCVFQTPRQFGQDMTNIRRAMSMPVLELSQKFKRRKLGKAIELKGSTTHETLLKVGKDVEAAIDRQTEMLSKLYDLLESRASLK